MPYLCSIDVPDGAELADLLVEEGIEFPCGGESLCGGCRVRLVEGEIPVTSEMREVLTPDELEAGWRLACRARARGRVTLEVEQWHAPILADDARLAFESRTGLGIAIDLGTTTLAAQLLDLSTGEVLAVRTALNPQCAHGADVMTRIQFALSEPGVLTRSIREALGVLVAELAAGRGVREALICGNTAMHHLFCGEDVEPLSHVPFETDAGSARDFDGAELGWTPVSARVVFLPCLGGFVGSDILAGMAAVGWLERNDLVALIDLGTNGEIVVGNGTRALCASTAAGPAFEAGRIRMGMRAAAGAILRVTLEDGVFDCHVLGGVTPRGICGSGLVDAVAAGFESGRILPSGRLANGARDLMLAPPVCITQPDVRELQLAKAAIAAGLRILLDRWGAGMEALERVYLAGAFGNYVSAASAHSIGLLEMSPDRIEQVGNTALRGTKTLLLQPSQRAEVVERIGQITEHISLASDARFQETFVDCMGLGAAGAG